MPTMMPPIIGKAMGPQNTSSHSRIGRRCLLYSGRGQSLQSYPEHRGHERGNQKDHRVGARRGGLPTQKRTRDLRFAHSPAAPANDDLRLHSNAERGPHSAAPRERSCRW